MGRSLLLVTWSGGGNIHPLVALGVQLATRGHRVRCLGPEELRRRFEREGLAFRAYKTATDRASGPAGRARRLRERAEDVLRELERERPGAAVIDFMMPEALSGAEAAGVPAVAFVHTLYQRVALSSTSPMGMSGGLEPVNELRRNLGLTPLASLPDLLDRCAMVLVATAPSLDRPELPLPSNVHYTGPLLERPGPDEGWKPPFPQRDRPLIHVSMGTVAPPEMALPILQNTLDGLADSALNVLVTLPRAQDQPWSPTPPPGPEALRIPSNTVVRPFTRHSAVMPHTSVFVTHAGLGSVGAALALGVPMVCLPIFIEQPENAAQVEAAGAGLGLPKDASPEVIRGAVEEVLRAPQYREAAGVLAEEIRLLQGGALAIANLERIVDAEA